MKGAFICPSCKTRNACDCKSCREYIQEGEYDNSLKGFVPEDFVLFNYQSHPTIKAPLSN
jgi:thymidylate synthase